MGRWTHRVTDALRRRGHEVDAWFSDQFPRLARSGSRLPVLLAPPVLAFDCWKARGRYDVLLLHEPLGFWSGVVRRTSRRLMPGVVCMCHNVESHHFADMRRATLRGDANVSAGSWLVGALARRWQSDGAIRLADAVVCLSSYDCRYLLDTLSVPPDRVFRVSNGVDLFPLDEAEARGGVLFVGGWLDVKGRRLLPKIVNAVLRRAPDTWFTLVGTGVSSEVVERDFNPGGRARLRVIPRIESEEDLRRLMRRTSVLLLPSLSEGSPLALLEAMAAGMGIVASRVGGVPDILKEGETGLMFAPGAVDEAAECVAELLGSPQQRSSLGSAARKDASRLTWDATALQIERALLAATGAK